MRIMCLGSKWLLLALGLLGAHHVMAAPLLYEKSAGEPLDIKMVDGSHYRLELFDDVEGVYYDGVKHRLNDDYYFALFQVSASNPGKPAGYCGAGDEIWLYVYKEVAARLVARKRVLVSSCLRSISMASQNTGDESQATDLSSLRWTTRGFSIDWFSQVDAAGTPLKTTEYLLRGEDFIAHEIAEDSTGK